MHRPLGKVGPGETSLSFLLKIYRSARQPITRWMRQQWISPLHENPKLGVIAMGSVSSKCAVMLNRGHRAKSGQRAQRPSDRTQAGAGAQLIANHDSFCLYAEVPLERRPTYFHAITAER